MFFIAAKAIFNPSAKRRGASSHDHGLCEPLVQVTLLVKEEKGFFKNTNLTSLLKPSVVTLLLQADHRGEKPSESY